MKKPFPSILLLSLFGASPLFSQTLWNVATGGNWDLNTNWNPTTVPNAIGADARITNLTTVGAYSISASAASTFTMGRLDFGATTNVDLDMTLASNVGLIFDVSTGSAQLNLATGGTGSTMLIQSAIQLNDNLTSTSNRLTNQTVAQFTGAINLQGNTWTVGSMNQGLLFTGLISGTSGSFGFTTDQGSTRSTQFNNTASSFTGGVVMGKNNQVILSTSSANFTGTSGGGILGTGTISVAANSIANDASTTILQANGSFPANDADTTTNTLANAITVDAGRFLRIDTPRGFNYTGTLSGAGTIVKTGGSASGSRTFAINNTNSGFTGTVIIQDGQLLTRVTDALGSSATIRFNPSSNTTGVGLFGSTVSGTDVSIASTLDFQRTSTGNSQFITTAGNSTFTLSGNFSNSGSGTAGYIGLGRGNGTLTNVGGGYALGTNTGNATIRLTGTGTLENNIGIVDGTSTQSILSLGNTSGTQTFSGIISGNGDVVRNGAGGTTILSNTANSYTGITSINAGTLSVSAINNGGTAGGLGQATNVAGNLVLGGGTLAYTGSTASTDRSYTLTAATSSTMDIVSGATLTLSGGSAATTGALTKANSGNLTLTGNNQHTGATTISGGNLNLSGSGALSSSTAVNVTGATSTFDISGISGSSSTIGSLAGVSGSVVALGGKQLNTGNNGGSTTFGGIISGNSSSSVVKNGNGSMTLTGANTYSGDTFAVNGTLAFSGGGTANSSTIRLGETSGGNGATLSITDTVGANTVASTLVVRPGSSGVKTISATNTSGTSTFSGGVFLDAGVTSLSTAGGTLAFTNAVFDLKGNQLTTTGAGTTSISGVVQNSTGSGKIVKQGAGTLVLSGANTYGGNTEVDAGIIRIDGTPGNASSNYFVGNGATPGTAGSLFLGGASGTGGGVTLSNLIAINAGTSNNRTLGGTNAAGTTNTFAGTTYSNGAGGLTVTSTTAGANLAFTNSSAIDLKGTSVLFNGAGNTQVSGAIYNSSASGSVTQQGSGITTFSGANTYSGGTTVSAGYLLVNNTTGSGTGSGAVTVSGGILGGTGTISGATTLNSGGVHSPGDPAVTAGVGKQTFGSSVSYETGSIFEWNLAAIPSETGRSTSYDAVNAASLGATTGAIFRVVLNGVQDFSEGFWDSDRTWSEIFKTADAGSALNIASIFSGTVQYYNGGGGTLTSIGAPGVQGSFTLSGTSLNWTAVPEPSSALVGVLLASGLLRRRRNG